MGEWTVLLVPLVLLVLGTLLVFVGCDDWGSLSRNRGRAGVQLSFTNPSAVPHIVSVKFRITIEGTPKDVTVDEGRAPSPGAETLFDPESVYHQEPETPYSLSIFPVAPDDWEVRCDARDADGKSYPYFDETRPLVQTVSDGQNYAKFEFVLNLFTGRVMPADTAKSTGKEVILSLTYGGAKEAKLGPDELENVKFYVRLNEVEEKALTVTQAAVTPAPFLGVTPGRKVTLSPPSGGDWVATLPTPPAATWTVRCEAFKPKDTANNPTFESGQSRTLPVDPGQSVPFEFELVLSPTRAVPK